MTEASEPNIKEIRRQVYISEIRARSRVPFSEFRRRDYEANLHGHLSFVEQFPDADFKFKKLPPDVYAEEDKERNRNMITSADILDMYLAELGDFRKGLIGIRSRRTEKLAQKVSMGLWWCLDFDEKRRSSPYSDIEAKDLSAIKDDLLTMETSRAVIAIHRILNFFHRGVQFHTPIRDLWWQPTRETVAFLDFLDNGLE